MRIRPDFLFSLFAVGVLLAMASDGALAAYVTPLPALGRPILLPVTSKATKQTCIILNGDEYCLVKKGVGGGMGGGEPGTGGGMGGGGTGVGGMGGGGMGAGGMGGGGMGAGGMGAGAQPGNNTGNGGTGNGGENGTGQGGAPTQQNNLPTNTTTQTEPGEHTCPAGYVVLDKPNKYGAFCEPKEGFPGTPNN